MGGRLGHWLANPADEPGVEACGRRRGDRPDTGHRRAARSPANVDPNAPAFARAMLSEVVDMYPAGSSVTGRFYVTLTFSSVMCSD